MHVLYRFGPFTLDAGSFTLHRGDSAVPLPPKLVDLLGYLVARPSMLVSKEELFESLWPDVVVTENALTQAVSDLRQALGDDRSRPTYIQTVAKRGYRFVAPVEAADPEPTTLRARRRREKSAPRPLGHSPAPTGRCSARKNPREKIAPFRPTLLRGDRA